jgi:cytochrome b561
MTLRYTAPAVVLHWLITALIFVAFPLGVYMSDLPLSPTRLQLYSYHKWIGISVLLLVGLRIVWRLTHRPPALPDDLPRWQRAASHAVHGLLYLLILAVPMTGWLMSSAKGFQTVWFGVLPLPDLVEKNRELGQALGSAHEFLNYLLLALVILHVVAALKHHFHERRPFLQRMGLGK